MSTPVFPANAYYQAPNLLASSEKGIGYELQKKLFILNEGHPGIANLLPNLYGVLYIQSPKMERKSQQMVNDVADATHKLMDQFSEMRKQETAIEFSAEAMPQRDDEVHELIQEIPIEEIPLAETTSDNISTKLEMNADEQELSIQQSLSSIQSLRETINRLLASDDTAAPQRMENADYSAPETLIELDQTQVSIENSEVEEIDEIVTNITEFEIKESNADLEEQSIKTPITKPAKQSRLAWFREMKWTDRALFPNRIPDEGLNEIQENVGSNTREANISNAEQQANKSIEPNYEAISETLAKIYVQQGRVEDAISVLEKLKLKFPERSFIFADQISALKAKV